MNDFIPPHHKHPSRFPSVGLGNKGRMLGSQKKAYENHSVLMPYLKTGIFCRPPLQKRFQDLLRRMNFPE